MINLDQQQIARVYHNLRYDEVKNCCNIICYFMYIQQNQIQKQQLYFYLYTKHMILYITEYNFVSTSIINTNCVSK